MRPFWPLARVRRRSGRWRRIRSVDRKERMHEALVALGEEQRDGGALLGRDVAVRSLEATDEALGAQATQVVAHLRRAIRAQEQPLDDRPQLGVAEGDELVQRER